MNRSQGSARDDEPRQRASCVSCSDVAVAGPDLLLHFFLNNTPFVPNYKSLCLFWYIHFAMHLDIIICVDT